jgi:UDP-N-acetyl-D-mannosaminuronic acid dehydrogenase
MDSDVVAIMIGTPVDGEGNPRVDDILSFVQYELCEHIGHKNKLIILRSTVAPGTTELIKNLIEKETGLVESRDFHLVFAPERVAQGVGISESRKFPQLIGAFSDESFEKAKTFFDAFVPECIQLEPREAEFGKLMTNMYRYVNFALANEFYMIGAEQNVDIHKVIAAANKGYSRMALPFPGPNVGGPCLFKDGKFLLETVQYDELIRNSFTINEGMPQFLFNMIMKENESRSDHDKIEKIGILGATFKADCDDIRNSLSFKFAKICKRNGIAYDMFDPYIVHVDNVWPTDQVGDYDAFIVMTPHIQFKKFYEDHISKTKDVLVVDAWKFLDASKKTKHGIFYT